MIHAGVKPERQERVVRIRRISPGFFWALLLFEAALLAAVLAWVLPYTLPRRTPQQAAGNVGQVHAAILERIAGTTPDPLIEVQPGITARASNMRGLVLGNTTYYYYFEGRQNFDPLSTGMVVEKQVQVQLRDDAGPHTLVILYYSGLITADEDKR